MKALPWFLFAFLLTGGVGATIYRGAISMRRATSWTSATGGNGEEGFYNKAGTPVWHPNPDAGVELAAALPVQTGQSGKFLTTNGTAAVWGTPSGGGGGTELFLSFADYVATQAFTNESGDDSLGVEVSFTTAATATGIRTYWSGGATTLKASLWLVADGTRKASGTLAVTGAGVAAISFATPFSVTAWTPYVFSVYDTAALHFTDSSSVAQLPPTDPFIIGAHAVLMDRSMYHAGDAAPDTAAGLSIIYPTTPSYTVP